MALRLRPFGAFLLILGVLGGCRKPDADLGNGLLPGDPLATEVEDVQLHAFTRADTNFRSSSLSRQLLGSFVDPRFGFTRAGIVTQVRLSASSIGSPTGLIADSIVLALAFDGANYGYGNMDAQEFQVHELDERLSIDSIYRSDRVPQVVGPDLLQGRGRVKPEPLRKQYIMGDSALPQLRLRLSDALAQRFLLAFGTPSLTTSDAFLDFFKGLYITVTNNGQAPYQGGLLYFNLISAPSKLTLYYRDQNSSSPDLTRALDFPINSNAVRYTTVEHDQALATTNEVLLALSDTISPSSVVYVQALAGLRTVVRMPSLIDYRGQSKVLAKAELVLTVDGTNYPYYPPPSLLVPFRRNESGGEAFLPDLIGGIGALDGNYRPTEREYRFNITRFAQRVINGEQADPTLELVAGSGGITANRVALKGPAALSGAMRLRLTFTSY
ncbi:MAG: DUF4270 family protein [Flavobacteriales bacterium]